MVDLGNAETEVQIQDEDPAIQEGYVLAPNSIHCDHLCKEKVCASDCDSQVKKKDGKHVIVTCSSSQVPSKPARFNY